MSSRVLNLILSHQRADQVAKMLEWWTRYVPAENILLVYTGPAETFLEVAHPRKLHLVDPRLQTRDHQRELQSYTGVFAQAARFLETEEGRLFTHVHFAEYDQIPLIADINERQVAATEREQADVLGFQVVRTDGTNHCFTLYHEREERFHAYWQKTSCRADKGVVLSMFGCGSFWTREALLAAVTEPEPFPMYLEVYLPTCAHHRGCRVRDFEEQARFVVNIHDRTGDIETARAEGGWSLHPVKTMW